VTATGRRRKFFRGTFTFRSAPVLAAVGAPPDSLAAPAGEAVTLDFADPPPWARVADEVKEMYDAGVKYEDMAARLNCPQSWPAKALALWHRDRGLPPPDGRTVRERLATAPEAERIAEPAKALWDQGRLMRDIAAELGCCRDTVTAAIAHWFASRGLAVPDGRARRKTLGRASGRDDEVRPAPGGQDAA